jgi:hypothetical protein
LFAAVNSGIEDLHQMAKELSFPFNTSLLGWYCGKPFGVEKLLGRICVGKQCNKELKCTMKLNFEL